MVTQIFHLDSLEQTPPKQAVIVIGNFDAVHLGHRYLIDQARKIATEKNTSLAILTFEPHPRRLFRSEDPPFRITPQSLKLQKLIETGVDTIFILPFSWETASLPAEDFVTTILKEKLDPACIIIGNDFHFGHNRSGNKETIKNAGIDCISIILKTDKAHGIISATRIRGLIQSGHIDEANVLLGCEWTIEGVVKKGDQRGRELGYPTANIPLGETIHPAYGVYATRVRIEGEQEWRMAATNIGIRPMFEVKTALVEAHILDFSGDLYGKKMEIKPVKKIRGEEKFPSLEILVAQIEKDCMKARDILNLKPAA